MALRTFLENNKKFKVMHGKAFDKYVKLMM